MNAASTNVLINKGLQKNATLNFFLKNGENLNYSPCITYIINSDVTIAVNPRFL